jgi:hypothetical protein
MYVALNSQHNGRVQQAKANETAFTDQAKKPEDKLRDVKVTIPVPKIARSVGSHTNNSHHRRRSGELHSQQESPAVSSTQSGDKLRQTSTGSMLKYSVLARVAKVPEGWEFSETSVNAFVDLSSEDNLIQSELASRFSVSGKLSHRLNLSDTALRS